MGYFVVGFLIGGFFGFVVSALAAASGRYRDQEY